MSVPHSTILSCSRGVLAKTDVGYCSPKQSQNSSSYAENNVKVVVYPKKEDARINAPTENGLKDDSCSFLRDANSVCVFLYLSSVSKVCYRSWF